MLIAELFITDKYREIRIIVHPLEMQSVITDNSYSMTTHMLNLTGVTKHNKQNSWEVIDAEESLII